MADVTNNQLPEGQSDRPSPATPDEARRRLEDGNRAFAEAFAGGAGDPAAHLASYAAMAVTRSDGDGLEGPVQKPFAAVLGCSDARVPIELVFNQTFNDLFVVRVAGNVLGSECLGSINYAMEHLEGSLRLLVVLGHSGCGAVAATVDAFITPGSYLDLVSNHSLRSVVDRISIGVRAAARALETVHGHGVVERPGYRKAMIDLTVSLHAALTAHTLELEFERHPNCGVCFGVYDLATRRVGLPAEAPAEVRLMSPPSDRESFADMLTRLASSRESARLALGPPS